ncbi:MAG: nitroreductase family protein [Chloroflexota bacterium]|nr:nitroreductase family protein [Chloroflexota bacterium]
MRTYSQEPVPDEVVAELLQIARSSGSWANSQPWHFVVIRDRDTLRRISQLRPFMAWLADVPLAIAIMLDGAGTSQAYDEGRVTERLLIGAHMLGLGAGNAWFGGDAEEAEAKRILGIPADRTARSLVGIGHPRAGKDPVLDVITRGRKPLSEMVSYERWGKPKG